MTKGRVSHKTLIDPPLLSYSRYLTDTQLRKINALLSTQSLPLDDLMILSSYFRQASCNHT